MDKGYILSSASDMFYSIGFKTVTMDDIATKLGVSKKTLYELFGSKENLIAEVLNNSFLEIQEYVQIVRQKKLDAVAEFFEIKKYIHNRFYTVQKQNSFYQLQRYYAKLYMKIYIKQTVKIIENLTRNFEKGKVEKLYRSEIEPELYAKIYLETQRNLEFDLSFDREGKMNYEIVELHSDIFIRGLLSPTGLERYEQLKNA